MPIYSSGIRAFRRQPVQVDRFVDPDAMVLRRIIQADPASSPPHLYPSGTKWASTLGHVTADVSD